MHSQDAVGILKTWLLSDEHVSHPYPTEEDKKVLTMLTLRYGELMFCLLKELMEATGLDRKQLTNWFTNARKRIWQPKFGTLPSPKVTSAKLPKKGVPSSKVRLVVFFMQCP
jgi:hypothetical protein